MTGLFGKLFSKKKKDDGVESIVIEVLENIIGLAGFELSFDTKKLEDGTISVDIFGKDEELLTAKDGALLDSLQLYVRRAAQHQVPDDPVNLVIDCANFREQANDALIELADRLKEVVLSKGKSVYFRALPPKDRKVIHQYLAEDGRVKSRSVGEGHFKKIKIYLAKNSGTNPEDLERDEAFGNR